MQRFRLAAIVLALITAPVISSAQTPPVVQDTSPVDLPRVFLDCQASGCDIDFLRTELTWVSFVRDRNVADVYILLTEQTTGGGGREYSALMQGQGRLAAGTDTSRATAPQGATPDELRRIVLRFLSQGLMRVARDHPVAARLNVTYQAPRTPSSGTRGARDRWNLWVFRISSNASMDGDANYQSSFLSGSLRATRTTELWKTILSFGGNYSESHFTLPDAEEIVNYQHGYNSEVLLVRSLGPHWSWGLQALASRSSFLNQDANFRFGPAIEYDFFPYSESTRQQIIVRYGPGVRHLNYRDITIYDELAETRPDHRLVVATDIRRSWGNIGGSVTVNQYLHDLSKRSADINLGIRWRIVTGLEFNISGGYSQIRDQVYIPRGELTEDDVLIRRRQLLTGYRYYAFTGLSYTFGSVFNNVVNPRFTQGGGGFFFF